MIFPLPLDDVSSKLLNLMGYIIKIVDGGSKKTLMK